MSLKKIWALAVALLSPLILAGCFNQGRQVAQNIQQQQSPRITRARNSFRQLPQDVQNASVPSQSLTDSVLTTNVRNQLGNNLVFDNGSYVVNNNQADLNTNVRSAPYVSQAHRNPAHHNRVEGSARAWLNRTSRQYKNRQITGNGAGNFKPVGFVQVSGLSGAYSHLYDRGHLIGYALAGNIRGFDASESNPNNIATQTAWSNEAMSNNSKGQNYYENIVRTALDQNKQVMYVVTPIYNSDQDVVPVGNHIQAQSKDGSVNFNVFVPNVQNGFKIDYTSGVANAFVAGNN